MQDNQTSKFLDEFDFIKILTSILRFLLNAKKHIIAAFIVGVSIACFIYFTTKPQYVSTMTAYSAHLQDAKAVALIEDLKQYLVENDFEQLSKKLGMSIDKVRELKSMDAAVEINKFRTGDSKEGFTIKVGVTNKDILDSLGLGLKRYIESSEYVNDEINSTRLSIQYNITKTEDELRALDTLRSSLYKMILKGGQARVGSSIVLSDISYVSSKRIELNDRLSSLKQQLQLCYDLKVIKQFSRFKKKSWPRLSVLLIACVSICEVLALLLFSFRRIKTFFSSLE